MGPDVSGAMERLCMSNPLSTRLFVSLPFLWAVAFPREVPLLPNLYTCCPIQLRQEWGNNLPTMGQSYNSTIFFHTIYANGALNPPFRPLGARSPEGGSRLPQGSDPALGQWRRLPEARPPSATKLQ